MKVAVIGSGSWGTALAQVLADNSHDVLLYGRDEEVVRGINSTHQNGKYFPGFALSGRIEGIHDLARVRPADAVLMAVPVKAMEQMSWDVDRHVDHPVTWINVAKGLFPGTNERMSQVIRRCAQPGHVRGIVSLIGPSFAREVMERRETLIDAASEDPDASAMVQKMFSNEYFRVYTLDDLTGAETASSLKNVMALATGMADGLGMGSNSKAALITRGLAEMTRFGVALGGKPSTFLGLSGAGDLVLTCTSTQSRNFSAGKWIGQDDSAENFWKKNTRTVEGVGTVKAVYEYSRKLSIEMPITEAMNRVLYHGAKPSECVRQLMNRSLKAE